MNRTSKSFAIVIILMAISSLSLIVVKPANAQSITILPVSNPVIIATPTPTPRPTPFPITPSPTPVPNVSLDYDEVSQTTQGSETVVTLRVMATYNFGDTTTYDFKNFVLDIRTSRGGLEPYPIYLLTGTANPLESGSVTVGSNNRIADFTLTFRFSTIQNSFGGPIHFAFYELVYNSNAVSTITSEQTPKPTPTPIQITTPTPSPNQSLSPSPTMPEFPVSVILPFFVSIILVAACLKYRRTDHE
jgi:hypothetical protein